MYVIAFDLIAAALDEHHPQGSRQAYRDIERKLRRQGFKRIQWSVYAADTDDMGKLFMAIQDLRELPWLSACLDDLRVFQTDKGSDFTQIIKTRVGSAGA